MISKSIVNGLQLIVLSFLPVAHTVHAAMVPECLTEDGSPAPNPTGGPSVDCLTICETCNNTTVTTSAGAGASVKTIPFPWGGGSVSVNVSATCTTTAEVKLGGGEMDKKTCTFLNPMTFSCSGQYTCTTTASFSADANAGGSWGIFQGSVEISSGSSISNTCTGGASASGSAPAGSKCTEAMISSADACTADLKVALDQNAGVCAALGANSLSVQRKLVAPSPTPTRTPRPPVGPGPGYTPCLAGDTLVLLTDGTQRRLDEIRANDELMSFNGSGTSEKSIVGTVHKSTAKSFMKLELSDRSIRATEDHKFVKVEANGQRKLVPAMSLKVGDRLATDGSAVSVITSLKTSEDKLSVYSVTMSQGPQAMFANGIAAHSGGIDPNSNIVNGK